MTEHLPECWAKFGGFPQVTCICNELWYCEQRVRNEEQQRIEAALTFVGQHDAAWESAIRDKALDAAREAVAAMNIDYMSYGAVVQQDEALAAIGALREEEK